MKAVKIIILSIILSCAATNPFAFADINDTNESVGFTSNAANGNIVEYHLANIRDLIRSCTILPYAVKDGVRAYHHLKSHCPQVKVYQVTDHVGRARIKLGSHHFLATVRESLGSDEDFYDVEIREVQSKDTFRISGVLAYGDVLLGVLNGNTNGIPTKRVQ